jgi:hypothetical protein
VVEPQQAHVAEPHPRTWPEGSATGVGSLPGSSIREAVQLVVDELTDLPHLPELPSRGPGSEMVGRALGLLPDFPAAWGPTGWALTDRPGHDIRQAVSFLGEDLDTVEELLAGWAGPFKVQVCGPWTLAAAVELRSGRKILADAGACRDLHQAYAESIAAHVAGVVVRLAQAGLVLQIDEPGLPFVLDGEVPTPSGLTRIAAVDQQVVLAVLAAATGATGAQVATGVHCCAGSPPLRLLRQLREHGGSGRPGLDFASVDASALTERDDDAVGEAVEAGLDLFLGITTTVSTGPDGAAVDVQAASLRGLWRRLGLPPEQLARMVVTPSCGLSGAPSLAAARAALVICRQVARQIRDDPEGSGG